MVFFVFAFTLATLTMVTVCVHSGLWHLSTEGGRLLVPLVLLLNDTGSGVWVPPFLDAEALALVLGPIMTASVPSVWGTVAIGRGVVVCMISL